MWWPFNNKNKNYEEELKGLEKAQEMLNDRFEKKLVSNEVYLKKTEEIRKKIDKCKKYLSKE